MEISRWWWSRSLRLPVLVCALITLALSLWPGDTAWGGDDVTLIASAIRANQQHRLIDAGLGGSFGYPYGPVPEQIYQLLAMCSHDPVLLVRLHALLFGGFTACSLLWLATVLNFNPWFAPLVMLGPFFWFYARLLWDNTFAIPIGILLLASYGDYLRRKKGFTFLIAASCAIALPLIHPMTLPLVMAVVIHVVWFGSDGFRSHWRGLIVIAFFAALLNGRYVQRFVSQLGHSAALTPPRADALLPHRRIHIPTFFRASVFGVWLFRSTRA